MEHKTPFIAKQHKSNYFKTDSLFKTVGLLWKCTYENILGVTYLLLNGICYNQLFLICT